MKVTTYETLYHEDHGATLKHKCGKRIVTLSLLSFSLIFLFIWPFYGVYLFLGLLFFYGLLLLLFPHLRQCSNNDDHHTSIYLQLKNYNSKLWTKYNSMWIPPAVYRDMQRIKSDMYERIMNGGFATNTMSSTCSWKKQYDNVCHMNGTVESCMAIYLGMAMEMP